MTWANIGVPTESIQIGGRFQDNVSLGKNPKAFRTFVNGRRSGMSQNNFHTIWDSSTHNITYLSADTELFISSTNAGDGQTIRVAGLLDDFGAAAFAATGDPFTVTETILNGQTQVSVGEYFRAFTVENISSTATAGHVYLAEADTLTAGVPNTTSKIKAFMLDFVQITRMGLFTVPAGFTFMVYNAQPSVNAGDELLFTIKSRKIGEVFKSPLTLDVFENSPPLDLGQSAPSPLVEKTDIELEAFIASASANCSAFMTGICVRNT